MIVVPVVVGAFSLNPKALEKYLSEMGTTVKYATEGSAFGNSKNLKMTLEI